MTVTLRQVGRPVVSVPATILGHNLELVDDTAAALLSDRLENPKFAPPADPAGMALPWQPSGRHYAAFMPELISGISLSGNEAQRLHCYNNGVSERMMVQSGRSIRAGETLEVELWAKAEHQPLALVVRLTPAQSRRPEYAQGEITIDASYWKPYRLQFKVPQDDDQAVFWCGIKGAGTVWIDQIHLRPMDQPLLCREMIQKIGGMNIPVLRMPGGCLSANYHWKHGTGPVHLRPCHYNPGHHGRVSYDFGTDEYLELCHAQNIIPHIAVNVSTGTPEEAAEWAAYIARFYRDRGAVPPPAYFQLGNEHYGLWEHGHMTGPMYAQTLRDFIPPIRAAYPGCKIVALGEQWSDGLDKPKGSPWRKSVLEVAKELNINVITLNRYKGQWFDDDMGRQINAVESVTKLRHDLEELIQDCRSAGLTNTVGITEWNYWLTASHFDGKGFEEIYDAQHCLFTAGVIHMFARLAPDFELGNFYHLVNAMGIFRHRGADVIETPLAALFRLYRPAFPGKLEMINIESPLLGQRESAVDALCMKQENVAWLFLCNRDPHRDAEVALIDWPCRHPEIVAMAAASSTTEMTPVEIPRGKPGRINLPPLSIIRMRYEA